MDYKYVFYIFLPICHLVLATLFLFTSFTVFFVTHSRTHFLGMRMYLGKSLLAIQRLTISQIADIHITEELFIEMLFHIAVIFLT